jgi:hypothetical protein
MPFELPVVPGEVVGWRAWKLVTLPGGAPRLRSLYHDVVWPTDEYLLSDGRHGICAAMDRDHLEEMHRYAQQNHPRYVVEGGAIGRVALAGEIIEGERGYRAEKARVVSLVLPYGAWRMLDGLRVAYRVPVALGNIINRGEMSWT